MRRVESGVCDLLGGEWLLYWTSRDVVVPQGFLPQLDEWAAIDSRERSLSVEPGTPILIDPAGRIDPRLAYFLRRSKFGFLAEESKRARAAGVLAGGNLAKARGANLRRKLVAVPARLARPQRKPVLHLPAHWPWTQPWLRPWRAVTAT